MKTIFFTIDEKQLPAHTPEQFKEWTAYKVGARHDISDENPLADLDLHEFKIFDFDALPLANSFGQIDFSSVPIRLSIVR